MGTSSIQTGWHNDKDNARLDVYYAGTRVAHFNTSGLTVLGTALTVNQINDDIIFKLGTSSDIALVERSSILGANTALTGVMIGTPVTPAVAADSLLLTNITASGDILIAVNRGGNSNAAIKVAGSSGIVTLYYQGVAALVTGAAGLVTATSLTSTGAFIASSTAAITGAVTLTAKITTYNGIGTVGNGVPSLLAVVPTAGAITTSQSNIINYTPPATAGVYRVMVTIAMTSGTNSGNTVFTLTYKDANGASATAIVGMISSTGTIVAAGVVTGASTWWSGVAVINIDNSATAITLSSVVSGTVAARQGATLEQLI